MALLQAGENIVRIAFQSPVEYAQNEYKRHELEEGYPVLPVGLVPEYRGEDSAQMIRKMQAAFSWDWGPSYASSGIW
jgi:beta-mannosidase